MNEITFEVPNLDGHSPDELMRLKGVLDLLATYCHLKSSATKRRARGEIADALKLEEWADREYSKLPQWARW